MTPAQGCLSLSLSEDLSRFLEIARILLDSLDDQIYQAIRVPVEASWLRDLVVVSRIAFYSFFKDYRLEIILIEGNPGPNPLLDRPDDFLLQIRVTAINVFDHFNNVS